VLKPPTAVSSPFGRLDAVLKSPGTVLLRILTSTTFIFLLAFHDAEQRIPGRPRVLRSDTIFVLQSLSTLRAHANHKIYPALAQYILLEGELQFDCDSITHVETKPDFPRSDNVREQYIKIAFQFEQRVWWI